MRPTTSKPSPPLQTETPRPGSVRLVCWNADQARERSAALERAGFEVDSTPLNPSGLIGHFRQHTPSVILIDLDRLPSHGREVGIALRQSKATRRAASRERRLASVPSCPTLFIALGTG
jgi:hypothetical protein